MNFWIFYSQKKDKTNMPKVLYRAKNFRRATLDQIETANRIIDEYIALGYDLTLRQLYYQMVARNHIENSERSYKNFGNIVDDGRLAGLIDWERIVDRTRNLRGNTHFSDPSDVMRSAARWYRTDRWQEQDTRCEVWVEKDALIGIVERVCERLDVDYFACRGYNSQSEMWSAAQRFVQYRKLGYRRIVVVHLGDHDPSGIDMTRDIVDRMQMFGASVEVKRIALNWEQIEQYKPPPNFAKLTDTRSKAYVKQFGNSSWELDALEPTMIGRLIEQQVAQYIDRPTWMDAEREEKTGRDQLLDVARRWHDVVVWLEEERAAF